MKTLLGALPGLAVVGLLGFGFYRFLVGLLQEFGNLDSEIAKVVAAGSLTVLVSVGTLVLGKILEARAAVRQDLRDKKTGVYEKTIHEVYSILFSEMLGKEKLTEDQAKAVVAELAEILTIWGSDRVLKSFGDFKVKTMESPEAINSLFYIEDLWYAIRKDLGHKNKGLGRGDILRVFVNDIKAHV